MRDYQPHKNNPYWLEPTAYRRALAVVRDYDRMVRDYREGFLETSRPDGQPGSNLPGDPVERRVERLDRLYQDIRVVEHALSRLPREYRGGVLRNIQQGGWPVDVPAHPNTWSKWRGRFLFFVAQGMGLA